MMCRALDLLMDKLRIFKQSLSVFCFMLVLVSCSSVSESAGPYATYYKVPKPIQCVPYARDVSGIPLMGDAHTWWAKAGEQNFKRGKAPASGAVLVLSKTDRLRHGHLAVVKRVVGPRDIDITHSNWGSDKKSRSLVYKSMRVKDVSPKNDWSLLRFWNGKSFGAPYPAQGFIYQR